MAEPLPRRCAVEDRSFDLVDRDRLQAREVEQNVVAEDLPRARHDDCRLGEERMLAVVRKRHSEEVLRKMADDACSWIQEHEEEDSGDGRGAVSYTHLT